uniref:VWFC domain-containing protein n=1 Tax=Culex quinquefasciatus TaxID=7176 RepID=A0A1S4KDP3_CULQU
AGPVIRPRRMMRDIYGEITDASAQNVTNFIDTCQHDGTQVSRASIVCQKKHGCRAIQKTGECCPDYQCECQRDGKTYTNGEKVLDPDTPCRVCYCQGGEITCSQVTCYKRHDCEPKFIAGRCCPEYDNCPPLETSKITEATSAKEELIELKETEIDATELEQAKADSTSTTTTTPTTSTASPTSESTEGPSTSRTMLAEGNSNPLGIKIKETTKAEEIRYTDNRPKISDTMQEREEAMRPVSVEAASSHSEEANNLEHLDMNVTDDGEEGMKNVRHTDEDLLVNGTSEVTESGESLLPSSTAGPESEELQASSEASSSTSTTTTTTVRVLSVGVSTTAAPEDVSDEVTKKDKPLPAVVQIGDKLVIVDHNQEKPITVIQVEEVEGLQRGEDDISYDPEMYTDRTPDNRESPKHMKLEGGENEMLSTQADSSAAYETVYHGGSTENLASEEVFETQHFTEGPESAEHNDTQTDQLLASSEEFIQISSASSSEKPAHLEEDHTTVNPLLSSGEEGSTTLSDMHMSSVSSEASGDEVFDTHYYTEGPGGSSETTDAAISEETSEPTIPSQDLPADDMTTHRKTYIEDDEHDLIQPGFQPIPEDFSLPLRDQPALMDIAEEVEQQNPHLKSERKEDGATGKILSEVLEYRKNASSSTTTTTEASSEVDNEVTVSPAWLKEEPKPQLRAPGEPHLVPEWERNNGTNSTLSSEEDFSGAGELHVLKMHSEEYIDGSEGSGLSTARKDPEETTLAPSKVAHDIDSAESGSSESDSIKHNPKNDVESLKYDENENSTAEEVLPKKAAASV